MNVDREKLVELVMQLNAEQFKEFAVGVAIVKALDNETAQAAIDLYKTGVSIREVAARYNVKLPKESESN